MELKFTLCFIRYKEKYLMLFRQKQPNQFRWNGVGGKIESGESATNACLREIREETGLEVTDISFQGIVTWNDVSWNNPGGMFVFIAESTSVNVVSSDEGNLDWKSLNWIYSDESVVSSIPLFLPAMLRNDSNPMEHAFTYSEQEEILNYEVKSLQAEFLEQVFQEEKKR
jgi:8-oxo-dGTP diphosphatase